MRLAARAIVAAIVALPSPAAAQAFTAPRGIGSVTLAWQYVGNTGHRLSDGFYSPMGQSVSTSALVETEYAVTDRLSASVGIPYVFAKYTGQNAPRSGLPVDTCRCWSSSFADMSAGVRYRFGGDTWAVTPVARYGLPTHAYPYRGEAVVGKQLNELQLGVFTGLRLTDWLPKATVQAGYTYAFVEKPIDAIPINRSNAFLDVGYALGRRLYMRAAWLGQRTHGGLLFGSPTGNPIFPPGEFKTPEQLAESDRILKVRYMQLAGGLSYSAGPLDVFASYSKYVWGRDAHNGQVFGAGVTWYFGLPE